MKFGQKLSVTAFKTKHNTDKLDVVKNPINGKLFVSANGQTVAAVSKNFDATKDFEYVELLLEDTGTVLWCLHNPSSANVVLSM